MNESRQSSASHADTVAARPARSAIFARAEAARAEPNMWAIVTLVIWLIFLTVGLLGLWQREPAGARPPPPDTPEPPPVQATLLDVELTKEPADAPPLLAASDVEPAPPPPADAPALPPALQAVALPNPSIAFAVPVEGPVHIVSAAQATAAAPRAPASPAPAVSSGPPAVQHLTYGQGEGRQPAPDYPPAAVADQEQGAVGVRFSVNTDGRVTGVEVTAPCRWPLLNRAALDAVRDRWRFRPGPPRAYEVSVRFQLNSQ